MSAKVVHSRGRVCAQDGSIFLECAVSVSVFALFLLGAFDVIRIIQAKDALQNGVNRGGRFSVLGSVLPGLPNPDNDGVSVKTTIEELSGLSLSKFEICKANGTGTCGGNYRGDPKDWIYIKAETSVPLLLNSLSYKVSADTLVRNQENFKFVTVPISPPVSHSVFSAKSY